MAATLKKWLDQTAKQSGSAANRAVYITEEVTGVNQFEEPAAGDLIIVSEDFVPKQAAELVSIKARTPGSRAPSAYILGPTDHGESPLKFPWRPPSAAGGTDVPMGHKAITAFFGTKRIPNVQAAEAIVSVVSHAPDKTVLRVAAAVADYPLGTGLALRKGAAGGTPGVLGNGDIGYVTKIDDTPGSGNVDLTFEPGFLSRPTTSDFVRGLNGWIPDEDWQKRWSALGLDGFESIGCIGGVMNTLDCAFSRREIFELTFGYQFRNRFVASEDQVRGDGSTDAFIATDLTLRVGDARRYLIPYTGGLPIVILRKMVVATGLQSGSDEKVKIASVNLTNQTITIESRSGSGVTATDLTAATSTQEVAGPTYDVEPNRYLDINIDNRGWLTVDLQALTPVDANAATLAEIVDAINYALLTSPLYGHYRDAHSGFDIDWGAGSPNSVASVASGKVRLTSKLWGSQSRIAVRASASNSAHNIIFTGAFDISATDEIQILPWTPGGTESRTPIHGREGISKINGYVLETTACTVKNGNASEWLEDVRIIDPIGPAGVIPGAERAPEIEVSVDARAWTGRLQRMADLNERVTFSFQAGGDALGSGFSFFCKGRISAPEPSGDNRRQKKFTIKPETWIGTTVVSAVSTDYTMAELVAANA